MAHARLSAVGFALALAAAGSTHAGSSNPPDFYPGMQGMASCLSCHKNASQSFGGPGSMSLTGVPAAFDPGKVYTVTMQVKQAGAKKFGFELYAVDQTGKQAGKILTDDVKQDVRVQRGVTFLKSSFNGVHAADQQTWTFQWQAPTDPATKVGFYAEAVAADGSGSVTGDQVYKAEAVVESATYQAARAGEAGAQEASTD